MPKTKTHEVTSYHYPRRTSATPTKEWLKTRMKFTTGYCNPYQPRSAQGHEGEKLFDQNGVPRKVCPFWDTCPCSCHYEIDRMYDMAGLPREPGEQSPEYEALVAEKHLETELMIQSLDRLTRRSTILSNLGDTMGHPDIEGPHTGQQDGATGTPAVPAKPSFAPTPTGRRARGQLEYDVLDVCITFASGVFDWEYCTPKWVSEQIGKKYAVEPPSTGAINAVWDRWEKLGFAKQDKKPSRFVEFTVENPTPALLESIKVKAKREKKRGVAEQRRGIPRPVRRK